MFLKTQLFLLLLVIGFNVSGSDDILSCDGCEEQEIHAVLKKQLKRPEQLLHLVDQQRQTLSAWRLHQGQIVKAQTDALVQERFLDFVTAKNSIRRLDLPGDIARSAWDLVGVSYLDADIEQWLAADKDSVEQILLASNAFNTLMQDKDAGFTFSINLANGGFLAYQVIGVERKGTTWLPVISLMMNKTVDQYGNSMPANRNEFVDSRIVSNQNIDNIKSAAVRIGYHSVEFVTREPTANTLLHFSCSEEQNHQKLVCIQQSVEK